MADKRVSEMVTGQIGTDSLVPFSVPDNSNQSGYGSRKDSASAIADRILNTFEFPTRLNTEDKTIFGAINEAAQTGGGGGSSTLAGLTDVDINNPTSGQTLRYNGTNWENADSSDGIASFKFGEPYYPSNYRFYSVGDSYTVVNTGFFFANVNPSNIRSYLYIQVNDGQVYRFSKYNDSQNVFMLPVNKGDILTINSSSNIAPPGIVTIWEVPVLVSGGGGTSSHEYSTEEHVVGTWIDGSPVYERVFDLSSAIVIRADSWDDTPISNLGIDKIIQIEGINNTGTCWNFLGASADTGNYIRILNTGNADISLQTIILRYTKSSS